jgi:hypothetical protein
MSKSELSRFRAILTERIAELEPVTYHRDAITTERSADQLEEIQAASQRTLAVCNLDREFNQGQEEGVPRTTLESKIKSLPIDKYRYWLKLASCHRTVRNLVLPKE